MRWARRQALSKPGKGATVVVLIMQGSSNDDVLKAAKMVKGSGFDLVTIGGYCCCCCFVVVVYLL